jgi:hypothetical protein
VKKNSCLMVVCLLSIVMLLAGCAPTQKTVITDSNLPALKGTWSGWTTFSSYPANKVWTTMEIVSDTVPVRGKLILHRLPAVARVVFPIGLEDVTVDNSVTLYMKDGKITDSGTILETKGQNFIELTYYPGGKHRLDGRFYFYGGKGDLTLTKD